ncbi:hypothetical protein D3C86_1631100 [compost metagenome]
MVLRASSATRCTGICAARCATDGTLPAADTLHSSTPDTVGRPLVACARRAAATSAETGGTPVLAWAVVAGRAAPSSTEGASLPASAPASDVRHCWLTVRVTAAATESTPRLFRVYFKVVRLPRSKARPATGWARRICSARFTPGTGCLKRTCNARPTPGR